MTHLVYYVCYFDGKTESATRIQPPLEELGGKNQHLRKRLAVVSPAPTLTEQDRVYTALTERRSKPAHFCGVTLTRCS